MALESRESTRTRCNTTRMVRGFIRATAGVAMLLGFTAALQAQGGDKAKVGEAVKTDLVRLADLERGWYEKNRTFTVDLRALGFAPASGATITMAYASARSWAANATHPTLQPTTCFIVVSQPGGSGAADRPFCSESADNKQIAAAPQKQAAPAPTPAQVPAKVEPKAVAVAPVTQTPAPKPSSPKVAAPKPAPRTAAPSQQVVVNRRAARRAAPSVPPAVAPAVVAELPARAPSSAAALSSTRAAGGVSEAGVTEAVSATQFSERLNAFVASALELTNARMPEVVRDPYESTAEYQARVAAAFAAFQRREAESYTRSTRTYVVSIPVKGVKYDADRELVDLTIDPINLPVARSFSAVEGPRLSVACFTRPYFWCSPDTGMSYDGTDLWRVARAAARSADVLATPLTLVAKFVVGRREDARAPAVSLISMELQAKGSALARWDSATR